MRSLARTLALVAAVCACTAIAQTQSYKMCFLMFANVDDLGWSFSVNVGRLNTKLRLEALHPGVTFETYTYPNAFSTFASPADKFRMNLEVVTKCNVVVTIGCCYMISAVFGRPVLQQWDQMAANYTNITWLVMWDNAEGLNFHKHSNLLFFIVDQTPGYFLAGVAAATQARGCAAIMIPFDWNRNSHDAASGFVLGMKYANASKPVHVISMESFYDPGNEILVTELFQQRYGCDVTARYSDPRDADVFVFNKGAPYMSIGSHADLQQYVGDSVLASIFGSWDNIVVPIVSDLVRFGRIQPNKRPYVLGTASGVLKLSPVSPRARPGVQAAVDAAQIAVLSANDTVICGTHTTAWGATIVNDNTTGCRNRTETLPGIVLTASAVWHGGFKGPAFCANGSYASFNTTTTIQLVCTVCPANTFAISGARSCTPCPTGLISKANSSNCSVPPSAASTTVDSGMIGGIVAAVVAPLVAFVAAYVGIHRYAGWKKNKRAPRQPPLCLMFTDVEGSTDLWNTNPEGMAQAMDLHHAVIRKVIEDNNAYEVKTVGDAFMIATNSAVEGMYVALDIQKALHAAEWPVDFKRPAPWNGLKVRIGVHLCREVEVKYESIHNYYDYYGNDVNISARVEAFAQGGQICVSQATWREIVDDPTFESTLASELQAKPFARDVQLKGVDGGFTMYSIVPASLDARTFEPPAGHENDFAEGNGEGKADTGSDTHSTGSSTVHVEELPARTIGAVVSSALQSLSAPARRGIVSAMSKDLGLPVVVNQRRACGAIGHELGKRMSTARHTGITPRDPPAHSQPQAALLPHSLMA